MRSRTHHRLPLIAAACALTAGSLTSCQAPSGTTAALSSLPRESVRYVEDRMDNGNLDAFVVSGTFALVDVHPDGTGNQVAWLPDATTIETHPAAVSSRTWEDYSVRLRFRTSGGRSVYTVRHRRDTTGTPGYSLSVHQDADQWSVFLAQGSQPPQQLADASAPTALNAWHDLRIEVSNRSGGLLTVELDGSDVLAAPFAEHEAPTGNVRIAHTTFGSTLSLDDLEIVGDVDSRLTWTQTDGPTGGWVAALAYHPTDPDRVYAAAYDGGLFRSDDGGLSFTEIGLPSGLWKVRIRTIVIAPSNPDVVYVGSAGKHVSPFWRSDDGGESWHWTEAAHSDREADTWAIAVDPNDAHHVYASVRNRLYESHDGGATMTQRDTSAYAHLQVIGAIAISPKWIATGSPGWMLAASRIGGVVRYSRDGGGSWYASTGIPPTSGVVQLVHDPLEPHRVFAVTDDGDLYRSVTDGETWTRDAGIGGVRALQIAEHAPPAPSLIAFTGMGVRTADLADPTPAWALLPGSPEAHAAALSPVEPSRMVLATWHGIQTTWDFGATFRSGNEGVIAHPTSALAVDPNDPGRLFTGGFDGLYRSDDAGGSWTRLRDGNYASVVVHPHRPEVVFIGVGGESHGGPAVLCSDDGGATFHDADPQGDITYGRVATLVFDPSDPERLYAGTGGGPQTAPLGSGLYRAQLPPQGCVPDREQRWDAMAGIPQMAVNAVAIDPHDSSRVFAATMGGGVYALQGRAFQPTNMGFLPQSESQYVYSLAIDPNAPEVLYAGTHDHYGPSATSASIHDSVYRSMDGGRTWAPILCNNESLGCFTVGLGGGIDVIVADPIQPGRVFVALHDPGVVVSDDFGSTWRVANEGFVPLISHVYPYRLAFSSDGSTLYAGSCGRGVFRNRIDAVE